jgi:hypothetical protein
MALFEQPHGPNTRFALRLVKTFQVGWYKLQTHIMEYSHLQRAARGCERVVDTKYPLKLQPLARSFLNDSAQHSLVRKVLSGWQWPWQWKSGGIQNMVAVLKTHGQLWATTRAPKRGLTLQRLQRNAQFSYLVSSDFCGKGGGPTVGELHLGGICIKIRRVIMRIITIWGPSFPVFGWHN